MTTYVCKTLVQNVCVEWTQTQATSSVLSDLSSLTYADTTVLLGYTASLFASAWLWKRLSLVASRM